jgi:hypothetical protein
MIKFGIFLHLNNINIAKNGQKIKKIKIRISIDRSIKKRIESAIIKNVLIKIPRPNATGTNSFLYSFFHGTNKVRIIKVRENKCKNSLFR